MCDTDGRKRPRVYVALYKASTFPRTTLHPVWASKEDDSAPRGGVAWQMSKPRRVVVFGGGVAF